MDRFSRKTNILQALDRWAGVIACFVLTICRKVACILLPDSEQRPPAKILFLKLAEQGSTVLAYGAICDAIKRVGRENVYFLVFEENRFIIDALGVLPAVNILTIQTRTLGRMIATCLSRLRDVRRYRIDACIDMEFLARSSAAICFLSGARIRVGFHSGFGEGPYRGDLMTHPVLYNPHMHTSRTFATLVAALDSDPKRFPTFDPEVPCGMRPLPQFTAAPEEMEEVLETIRRETAVAAPSLILLNANASDLLPLRRWNGANYVRLAKRLIDEFPEIYVAFTGNPEETANAEQLVVEVDHRRCFSVAGKTTLRQLLILYSLAQVLVTNDSGPAHFAALTPIDTVTLFGPETPLLFGTLSARSHPIWTFIPCSPCVNPLNNRQSACRDNICMQRITVDEVFEIVCKAYRNRRNPA